MTREAMLLDWKRIAILGLFLVFVFFFWNSVLVYPVKLFVVLLHELSHGLMAALTGGSIESIELDYRIGGLCTTRGGNRFLVASAGYLGSLVLGGLILVLTARTRFSHIVSFCLGLMVILVMLFYIPIGSGWLFSVPFAAVLIVLALYASQQLNQLVMMFIGLTSVLYAVLDIKQDLLTLESRGSDADILASQTGIPAIVWGLLWSILSVMGLLFFFSKAIRVSGKVPIESDNPDKPF
ncbi:M50 family metallopeptidase [bacterium]|nr:M50 family metallopeptidase [bacterium]